MVKSNWSVIDQECPVVTIFPILRSLLGFFILHPYLQKPMAINPYNSGFSELSLTVEVLVPMNQQSRFHLLSICLKPIETTMYTVLLVMNPTWGIVREKQINSRKR